MEVVPMFAVGWDMAVAFDPDGATPSGSCTFQ